MCTTCGCGADEVRVTSLGPAVLSPHEHGPGPAQHEHPHRDQHRQENAEASGRTVLIEQRLLAKNDQLAEQNRQWLAHHGVTAINLMSSPGAGKTTLLERTIKESAREITVIEGDQETLLDAERIRSAGARAVQINTGAGCHLDAPMVRRALDELRPQAGGLVVVENVGNLVCPALFDLGELRRVVVISVTEGDDKPLKYPHMFAAADLVVVNKIDLLPYVDFDLSRLTGDARKLKHNVEIIAVSARTGANLDEWHAWLGRL